jgi:predicted ATPase
LQALRPYIRDRSAAVLRRQLGAAAAVLAELFPELAERRLRLIVAALASQEARLRLFESIARFLSMIAADRPVVLVFDDLHWADPASLDLLLYVSCHQHLGRVLIAGAYREGEAGANVALDRIVDALNRDRLLTLLRLRALSPEEIAEIAGDLLDGGGPDLDRPERAPVGRDAGR